MPFSELLSCQVIPEHLLLKLSGVDDGIAVAFLVGVVSANIACFYEFDDRQISDSNRHCVGVPFELH